MPDHSPLSLSMARLATVLNDVSRWRILLELSKGQALPVKELAGRARIRPNTASKHMSVLLEKGLVVKSFGRLYALAPTVQVRREEGLLDLGPCLLRLEPQG